MKKEYLVLLRNAVLIAVLASAIGLIINGPLIWKVINGRNVTPLGTRQVLESDILLPLPVELDEVRELLNENALPVDARSREAFIDGHLPGARSLPRGADELSDAFRRQVPPDKTLIVYCSGYGCTDSFLVAEHLLKTGYQDVRVFEGGLPEWTSAGLPVEKGRP